MNGSPRFQSSSDKESTRLIDQIRDKTRLELEKASIKALRLSASTNTSLYNAGFRTIHDILYPTPEQLADVVRISEQTKREIREKLQWALRQWKIHFRQQVTRALRYQSPSKSSESNNTRSFIDNLDLSDDSSGIEPTVFELITDSLDERQLSVPSPNVDESLEKLGLFSTRVRNALVRRGIITLRLLLMHTPEMLLQNTTNLGKRGLAEVEGQLTQYGWHLAETADTENVHLTRLLAAAFYNVDHPLNLAALTEKVNFFRHSKRTPMWDEVAVAQGAVNHPYILETAGGRYQFRLPPLGTPIHPMPETRSTIVSEPLSDMEALDQESIIPYFLVNQSSLDDLLEGVEMFSTRVTNALVRRGIVTSRLLLMHTPELLLQEINNLGPKGLTEIEETLAQRGWSLAETTDIRRVTLYRLLAATLCKLDHPLRLSAITNSVNKYSRNIIWTEVEVAQGTAEHPYIVEIEDGRYLFSVHSVDAPLYLLPETEPATSIVLSELEAAGGKVLLSNLWHYWFSELDERQQEVLSLRYGVQGEDPLKLEEIGNLLGPTRERIRQIEAKALKQLGATGKRPYWQLLRQLLAEGILQAGGFLSTDQWERLLDEKTVWEGAQSRPLLLPLLCAVLENYHYLTGYDVATADHVKTEHLKHLDSVLKRILRPHKKTGLTAEELVAETQQQLGGSVPANMHEPVFILASMDLFERIGPGADGRYFYFMKKKKRRHPTAESGWAGQPDTRLHEWELELRQQFEKMAWIGQLSLTEADFRELCQIVQEEAQAPNYFTGIMEGQPRLVPPAVFMTLMVFAARYSQQEADEFWVPYLRTVWNTEYTQAFMARCRKRFIAVVPYLEKTFGFEFPRQTEGDLVTAVYRHALLPSYMQDDFAAWLRSKWRVILLMAGAPDLLMAELRQDRSLVYLPRRLQKFILDKATQDTAAALISNMAGAISLYVNDGESIESISILLEGTPIEQELWREVAQVFATTQQTETASLRQTKPRLTWVWSLDEGEMALRVQNIILPTGRDLEGEPDRLVWIAAPDSDPLAADIEVELSPWRMNTGEHVIHDVMLTEPDGPPDGKLVLLTDMDEEAARLDVPPFPVADAQFFRLTQQGAYGTPVDPAQVTDGVWLVGAARPLTFVDDEGEEIEPDFELPVPYPLDNWYGWAAQLTLSLPVTVKQSADQVMTLVESSSQLTIGQPLLTGTQPVAGLSRQVQPTFGSTQVSLTFEYGRERLLKQGSLWIRGQDGWRWQRPLAELWEQGAAQLAETALHIHLSDIIPTRPNFYTIELRASLQPILPAPLEFAVVPGLEATPPATNRLYTPANPPQLVIRGVDESTVVRREGLHIDILPDGNQQITWTVLRHEPRLMLRFDKVDIPLAWQVPHFMAWLEPKPVRPFLTLAELQQTTLHAVGTKTVVEKFKLFVTGQRYRSFQLRNGRYTAQIGQSQLYDMVRLAKEQYTVVKAQVGMDTWPLFEVRQRPQLLHTKVKYDTGEQMVLFRTGLQGEWMGNGRFVAESLTNPFAPLIELGQITQLKDLHLLPARLPDGVYLLRLELDDAWLPLLETAMQFTVGEASDDLVQAQQLVDEIRGGRLISPHLVEDFVLWWAEIAETGETELTPTTLYQLATAPSAALENFAPAHLQKLWPPLAALKAVYDQPQWMAEHGYLPAWALSSSSIILRTAGHGYQLRVYPTHLMRGGLEGKGYGRWRMSMAEDAPKELVYVQWQPISATQVHMEAGLPAEMLGRDWTTVDLLDTFALYYCSRCGRLTGVKSFMLPEEIVQEHRHGRATTDLRDVTLSEEYGGYRLLAEFLPERRGQWLLDAYVEHGIVLHSTAAYLPEPALPEHNPLEQATQRVQLLALIREIKRLGIDNSRLPSLASASRLLTNWQRQQSVSQLGQTALALGLLLRSAAEQQTQFYKLLKDASLSEKDGQNLLAELNRTAPNHVQWGLTWAELLVLHSFQGS